MSYRPLSAKLVKAEPKYAIRENSMGHAAPRTKYRRSRWDCAEDRRINYCG